MHGISHDGNKVASFMADDVVYEDLALGQVHEGKPQLRNAAGAMWLTNATLRPGRSGNVTAQHGNPSTGPQVHQLSLRRPAPCHATTSGSPRQSAAVVVEVRLPRS
jgi:hypothetical protein